MRSIVTVELYKKYFKEECNRVRALNRINLCLDQKFPPKRRGLRARWYNMIPGAGREKGGLLISSASLTKLFELKAKTKG